jgi:hypothetical protein
VVVAVVVGVCADPRLAKASKPHRRALSSMLRVLAQTLGVTDDVGTGDDDEGSTPYGPGEMRAKVGQRDLGP